MSGRSALTSVTEPPSTWYAMASPGVRRSAVLTAFGIVLWDLEVSLLNTRVMLII